MLARHRLIGFPTKQYHRIWNVVQCPFVAIHSIRFPSHGHEVGIGNIDVTGKFFGGWTNSLWIQDAVGFQCCPNGFLPKNFLLPQKQQFFCQFKSEMACVKTLASYVNS